MSENSESLKAQLVELVRAAFAENGLVAGKHWEEARLFFSFGENGTMRWWAWYRLGGRLGALGPRHPYGALGFSLRSALESELVKPVRRLRIDVTTEWETSITSLPTPSVDRIRDRWVWADEVDESGIEILEYPPALRGKMAHGDSPSYKPSMSEAPVVESLGRIRDWASRELPDLADKFNPPASEEVISAVESELGVVFPASVREAYLVANGCSDMHRLLLREWLPLETMPLNAPTLRESVDSYPRIPVMSDEETFSYFDGVADPAEESTMWDWYYERLNYRIADSFGSYLAQIADEMEAGEMIVFAGRPFRAEQL